MFINLMKILRRHYISWRAYRQLGNASAPDRLMALRQSCKGAVHIVCPGPSAVELQSFNIGENDAIVFVNHGVGLVTELSVPKTVCYYFITADTTRMIEISAFRVDALKLCKTIFAPYNLCHLKDTSFLRSIDFILQPQVIIDPRLGLEMRNLGAESMSALEMRPRAKGFGSLLFSVQLALFLGGRKIYLWGVDHGEVVGNDILMTKYQREWIRL